MIESRAIVVDQTIMRWKKNLAQLARKGLVMRARFFHLLLVMVVFLFLSACTFGFDPNGPSLPTGGSVGNGNTGGSVPAGEDASVNYVIDGDTIDVTMS